MKIIEKKNAEHYIWGQICDGWHLLNSENLSIIQERVPPRAGEMAHYHKNSEQFFYVLSDQMCLYTDTAACHLAAGQGLHIPAGVAHQMKNLSDTAVEFLVISRPKAQADRVMVADLSNQPV